MSKAQTNARTPRTEAQMRGRRHKDKPAPITEKALLETIQVDQIVVLLAEQTREYHANNARLEAKRAEFRKKQADLFFVKHELNILLQQLPEKKQEFLSTSSTALPAQPKDAFIEAHENKFTDRFHCLVMHKKVLYQFLSENLNRGDHLNDLQRRLDILFNYKTSSDEATRQLDGLLKTPKGGLLSFGKTKLNDPAQMQFIGYLKVLHDNNLFACKSINVSFSISLLKSSLQDLFEYHIAKELHNDDDPKSIKKKFLQEQAYQDKIQKQSAEAKKLVRNPRDIVAEKLDALNAEARTFISRQVEVKATDPVVGFSHLQNIASQADQLAALPAVQQSETKLTGYLTKLGDNCTAFQSHGHQANQLQTDIQVLEHQQNHFTKLNELLKFQILAAYGQYTQDMAYTTRTEAMVHGTTGLNQAKELVLSLKNTEYPDTLRLFAAFLQSSNSLRNHSFRTTLLKTIHEELYGFMYLLKTLTRPEESEHERAKQLMESQLVKYRQQKDLVVALRLVGEQSSIIQPVYPSEETRLRNKVSLALEKNLTSWGTLFSKSTQERKAVRNNTVTALKTAGAVVTTAIPTVAVSLLGGHHAPEIASMAAAGGFGFWSFCKAAMDKIMTPDRDKEPSSPSGPASLL